ncbi:MAG: DNA translocase FtsK [Ardenticatenia bacterium]|nr:DNA translocase FtsK [Ardenticatenia bacterium]
MNTRRRRSASNYVGTVMRRLGPMRRELIGLGLLAVTIVTFLSLLSITSGSLSDGWAYLLRQLFGWGVIPIVLGVGWLGAVLLLGRLRDQADAGVRAVADTGGDTPIRWDIVVAMELLVVGGLSLLHLLAGSDEPLTTALAGNGGGVVGWGISAALTALVGRLGTGVILLVLLLAAVGLLLSVSAGDRAGWLWLVRRISSVGRDQSRSLDGENGVLDGVAPSAPRERRRRKPKLSPEVEALPLDSQAEKPAKPTRRSRRLPSLDLLVSASGGRTAKADVRYQAQIIEDTLEGFGVPAKVTEINVGPAVTQFGVEPGYIERPGPDDTVRRQRVRVGKITSLINDLALALAAAPIRIEAPVPGRPVVGIEVPNSKVSLVSLRGVLASDAYRKSKGTLSIPLGRDVSGKSVVADLTAMPHLLIAGATGSGKSVCINAIVTGLMCDHSPDELKFLMVDPKMVELVGYAGAPHLLSPVIVDIDQVVGALTWVTRLMDERYRLFSQAGARSISSYNKKAARRRDQELLPHVVVIVDELADLMMLAPDEIERQITRIAQMARATGIHMVLATQRPSVDVVTGLIKANFPARVAFAVSSQVDSRVILDTPGAERLLGRGDCLLMLPDSPKLQRLQGCFVSDQEIHKIVTFWKESVGELRATVSRPWDSIIAEEESDPMLEAAIDIVLATGRASTTHLQRRLGIGYPRAARLMDQLEEEGIIGPAEGSQPREVLASRQDEYDDADEMVDADG